MKLWKPKSTFALAKLKNGKQFPLLPSFARQQTFKFKENKAFNSDKNSKTRPNS